MTEEETQAFIDYVKTHPITVGGVVQSYIINQLPGYRICVYVEVQDNVFSWYFWTNRSLEWNIQMFKQMFNISED